MKQGKIDGGMTTEPTVSRLLQDRRREGAGRSCALLEGTRKALGGTYPAAALYMQTRGSTATRTSRRSSRTRS